MTNPAKTAFFSNTKDDLSVVSSMPAETPCLCHFPMNSPVAKTALCLLSGSFLLSACTDSGPEGPEIMEQELPSAHRTFKLVDSSRERFRYQTRPATAAGTEGGSSAGAPRLVYETPEGWTEGTKSMMRDINMTFGENGEGECYVARLPGAGGGLTANVNRWRGQMGAEPLTEEEIAALPQKSLFGQPASFMSVDGDFTGMGGGGTKSDYRLLGVILSSDAGAVFVKMTGPRALVEANTKAFDQFVASLDVSTGAPGS